MYYRFYSMFLTAGIHNFFEKNSCFWLGDVVFSYFLTLKAKNKLDDFYIVKLVVKNNKAKFKMQQDLTIKPQIQQIIPFTDLKDGMYKFYFSNNVLMLPEEY